MGKKNIRDKKIRVLVEVTENLAYVYSDRPDEVEAIIVDFDFPHDDCGLLQFKDDTRWGSDPFFLEEDCAREPDEFDNYWKAVHEAIPYEG